VRDDAVCERKRIAGVIERMMRHGESFSDGLNSRKRADKQALQKSTTAGLNPAIGGIGDDGRRSERPIVGRLHLTGL
jgi:hypothetical protein